MCDWEMEEKEVVVLYAFRFGVWCMVWCVFWIGRLSRWVG